MSATAAATHPVGQDARKPTQIPAHGWKEILIRLFKQFSKDRVMLVAAGVTFYLLLAMVPAMTAFISLYGLFADPATVQEHISFLQEYLPSGGQEIIGEQLTRLSQQPSSGLGFALAISVGIALWSTSAGMKALFEAMNVAYDEEEKRGFVKLSAIALAFTLGAIVLLLSIIGVTVIMPLVVESIGLGALAELLVKIGSAVLLLLAGLVGLAALYRWGPSRSEAEWKWITPGALVAVVIAMIGSLLFSWYVANFGSYNETYGSLGAIIGFMTWLWIMMIFVITGGELNAEMEHQTSEDTTTGPEEPMGGRGAEMADTVADGTNEKDKGGAGPSKAGSSDKGSNHGSGATHERIGRPGRGHGSYSPPPSPALVSAASNRADGPRQRTRPDGTQEPIGVVGGLMLLGAVALAMAAGKQGRKTAAASRDPTTIARHGGLPGEP
jgi:membrane protein